MALNNTRRRSCAHLTHYPWTGMSAPLINLARVLREREYTNTLYRDEVEFVHSERIERISADTPFAHVHTHTLDSGAAAAMNRATRLLGMSDVDRIAVRFWRQRGKTV